MMTTQANKIKTFTGDDRSARHDAAIQFAKQYAQQWGSVVTVMRGMYEDSIIAGEQSGGTVCRPIQWSKVVDGVTIEITEAAGVIYANLPVMAPERADELLQSVRPGSWAIGNNPSMDAKTIGASLTV